MKKMLSLLLAVAMSVSAVPTAFAADYTQGTQVEYIATGTESYTITVPAKLNPGQEGTVTLAGTWADNRVVTVTAEENVTLVNSILASDQKVLKVTFDGISEAGNNIQAQTFTEPVSVAGIENALFGTWSGKFNYNVESSEKANTNEYGFYFGKPYSASQAHVFFEDGSAETWVNGECVLSEPAGTWTYTDHLLETTDGQLVVSSDGLVLDDFALYMDGYDNGGKDPVLNEYGFYFEEFYGIKQSFIFYEDGSGRLCINDNPEMSQSFPAGSFTFTSNTITMDGTAMIVSNNGTTLTDSADPNLVLILEQ